MSTMRCLRGLRAVPGLLVLLAACTTAPAGPDASLYARLGALPGIEAVVDETLDAMVADPRTRRSFEGIKMPALKRSVAMQICVLAAGPCKYEGETMRKAHKGLAISATEFDLMVAALRSALDRHVGTHEKNELLRLLAPMKRDIVGA